MVLLRLAYRNLVGAGLRTWLNVFVLSIVFLLIVWGQGLFEGMQRYMVDAMIETEFGGGQYWCGEYDPYDPFSLEESHSTLPPMLRSAVERGEATPVLITLGAFYPDGRVQTTLIKGIDPAQKIVNIPSACLEGPDEGYIPALIGSQTARQNELAIGDVVTLRWRDIGGTFDADDIKIVQIMNTTVPSVDRGQVWIPLERMRSMLRAPGQATIVIAAKDTSPLETAGSGWEFKDHSFLLSDITALLKAKRGGGYIFYSLLLFMGLLAIFDTQLLSIWRRRREIGTLIALGMERSKVIGLFTLEGVMHGLLAIAAAAVYGTPILYLTFTKGIAVPEISSEFGIAVPDRLIPYYGIYLIVGTMILVFLAVTIVSYLPASKIASLKPTDALRGKTT